MLLVTGVPGVGKTTLVGRVAGAREGLRLRGFYTEEIREGRERVGFRAVSFDGDDVVMAHAGRAGRHRVGRYGVDGLTIAVAEVPDAGGRARARCQRLDRRPHATIAET